MHLMFMTLSWLIQQTKMDKFFSPDIGDNLCIFLWWQLSWNFFTTDPILIEIWFIVPLLHSVSSNEIKLLESLYLVSRLFQLTWSPSIDSIVLCHLLRGLDTPSRFSVIFYKGDNFLWLHVCFPAKQVHSVKSLVGKTLLLELLLNPCLAEPGYTLPLQTV